MKIKQSGKEYTKHQQEADKLNRDKFNHSKKKDTATAVISIVCAIPLFVIVITFVVIWIKLLTH